MIPISSPTLPPTSDPIPSDVWQQNQDYKSTLPSSTYSDDFEALELIREDAINKNKQEGRVIQHRAWKLAEVFRSEGDHFYETPVRKQTRKDIEILLPSSSPQLSMPIPSSPIAYPPSSSPPFAKPRSKRQVEKPKAKTIGGFLQDESSDDEDALEAIMEESAKPDNEVLPSKFLHRSDSNKENEFLKGITHNRRTIGGFLNDDEDGDDEISISRIPDHTLPTLPIHKPRSIEAPATLSNFSFLDSLSTNNVGARRAKTCSGKSFAVKPRAKSEQVPYEQLVAARSTTKAGRATKSYYGIDIHQLIEDASKETVHEKERKSNPSPHIPIPTVENGASRKTGKTLMWTEKYRARKFTDLVGDDRTHRQVLRWLKNWDPIVFPNSERGGQFKKWQAKMDGGEEKPHRKILLLTGPPGLGKTTLAHVCARQAGYDVMEINASDERSKDVVKGRIRDAVGTESVKNVGATTKDGKVQGAARPVCVVVDEVDGVVGGSGGSGEGGFIKALIDLVLLDQKNTAAVGLGNNVPTTRRKKKGDNFRLLRPLILICNDVYHPSLRQLRQSTYAEIIHIRKPPLEAVITRVKSVFEREGVPCDTDGVRRLCEATWGLTNARETSTESSGTGEGDLRGIMVVGEWAAGKIKASASVSGPQRLNKRWVEENMMADLSHGGGGTRGIGRGGPKEIVQRVFLEGAGFPKPASMPVKNSTDKLMPKTKLGVSELVRRAAMERLREMVDTSGDIDRIVTDLFSTYPEQPFQDDTLLSKPNSGYEWLHFHDSCSSRVFTGQDWELAPYLSLPVLAYHHLFSSPKRHFQFNDGPTKKWGEDVEEVAPTPFSGPRASFEAHETEKLNRATLIELQSSLNPILLRSFRSPEDIAVDLVPYLNRMMAPEIKPVVVGGSGDQKGIASVRKESERDMVRRAVEVMSGVGIVFERGKLETSDFNARNAQQWVYRMEPPIDTLATFETSTSLQSLAQVPVRYAVRQVLDQEYQKHILVRENAARQSRYKAGNLDGETAEFDLAARQNLPGVRKGINLDEKPSGTGVKRDFFGRVVAEEEVGGEGDKEREGEVRKKRKIAPEENKVWVSFHEGFSNAVRKPITLAELMSGL